jgi:trimethylamine--corrinoid protein Co-methyltransferase
MKIEHVKPHISIFTGEQMELVHRNSIHILKNTGIKTGSLKALNIFKKSGDVIIHDDKVKMSDDIVRWAIEKCPKSIQIYDRAGNAGFNLGDADLNHPVFGIGVTNLNYQNPEDETVEPFSLKHMTIGTRLGNKLDSYQVISTIGVLHDVEQSKADLYGTLEMYANTEKPLIILVSDEMQFNNVIKLLEHLHGNINKYPFVIPYFNPVTPLILNESTVDKMILSIEKGLPIIYSNYSMYGATSPIEPASSLTLLNAELMAGLVFSQLIREGTPVILGTLPAAFDMQMMGSTYTPNSFLLNLACAEMMAFYKIPHCGASGSGIGWGADLLASANLWINHLTSCLGKTGLIPFVGGNFDSLAFSPLLVVYSDYVIRRSLAFSKGFSLAEHSFGLKEIEMTGAGGNFMTSESTLNSYMKDIDPDQIWPNFSLESWENADQPKAIEYLRKHTIEIINNLPVSADYKQIKSAGEEFIRNIKGNY